MKQTVRRALLIAVLALPLTASDCPIVDGLSKSNHDDNGDGAECLERADKTYDRCIAAGNTQGVCGQKKMLDESRCKGPIK